MTIAFERQGRRFEILPPPEWTKNPKFAVVIGTFAAAPYVHLHLEASRRLYPDTPCLVHDDGSPVKDRLQTICDQYGTVLSVNLCRYPPFLGDLSAFYDGLLWAKEIGADILVKFSRRFVPITDWRPSLARLVYESAYHTYSSWTTTFDFGFRTEAMAMAVDDWHREGGVEEIAQAIACWKEVFVEGFMHNIARRLPLCSRSKAWDQRVGPRSAARNGYAPWDWLGTDRCAKTGRFLWHDIHTPEDYAALASEWGLPYKPEDFRDPNMGCGDRPLTLQAIFQKYHQSHKTDKGSTHSYLPFYERMLDRSQPITLVEIGVGGGGSLLMWREWLHPASRIIGVDINPPLELGRNIQVIQADATKPGPWLDQIGQCDVVIDDASHHLAAQIAIWELLWPRLTKGGLYIIEDVQNDQAAQQLLTRIPGAVEEDLRHLRKCPDNRIIWTQKV